MKRFDAIEQQRVTDPMGTPSAGDREYARAGYQMVKSQLVRRGITNKQVLQAMMDVPRHYFVPSEWVSEAYLDRPLPIGFQQTISQPYIVGLMTEIVRPQPQDRVLDIGTGSGYQAAVISRLVEHVYSIEIVDELAQQARTRFRDLGYQNIQVRTGDGYQGWEEMSPFDIIIVAAAPDHVPLPLLEQLAAGGRMVMPIGDASQQLKLIEKLPDGHLQELDIAAVRFVPMTGEALRRSGR